MKRYNIALIGCGTVSRMHMDGYIKHPERVQMVAACDPVQENRISAQQNYDISDSFESVDRMINGAEWEIGVVCTPTPIRKEVIRKLASAKKHIFVEKPLADTYEEAEEIVRICDEHEVQLAVNQNFRYHYAFGIARQQIMSGKIGLVIQVLQTDLYFRQDRGWRIQCERHALSVMGIHWFDGLRWILQDEPVSIQCRTFSSPAIDCIGETDAQVFLTFKNGVSATIVQSFSSRIAHTETIIIGETGTLWLTYDKARLINDGQLSYEWTNPHAGDGKPESAYLGLDQLLIALDTNQEPTNSGHDNLKTVRMLDLAYQSADTRSTITFA